MFCSESALNGEGRDDEDEDVDNAPEKGNPCGHREVAGVVDRTETVKPWVSYVVSSTELCMHLHQPDDAPGTQRLHARHEGIEQRHRP